MNMIPQVYCILMWSKCLSEVTRVAENGKEEREEWVGLTTLSLTVGNQEKYCECCTQLMVIIAFTGFNLFCSTWSSWKVFERNINCFN